MTAPASHPHNWVDGTTAITAAKLNEDEADIAAVVTAHNTLVGTVAGKQATLTQTTTAKTSAYTAAANEVVRADTSGGTFAITGPTSGAPFGVRWTTGTTGPTVTAPAGFTITGSASVVMSTPPATSSGELIVWAAFGTDYQPVGGFKPQAALNAVNDTRYDATGAAAAAQTAAATDATSKANAAQAAATSAAATDATSKVSAHTSATDPHGDRAAASSALSSHVSATDPHGDRAWATGQFAPAGSAGTTAAGASQNVLTGWYHANGYGTGYAGITAAAAAANTAGGGVVYIPDGDYSTSTGSTFTSYAGVTFRGSSKARVLLTGTGDRTLWQFTGGSGLTIEGLTFVLPTSDLTHYSYGVRCTDVDDVTITRNQFQGGSSGVRIVGSSTGAHRVSIKGNRFTGGAQHPNADKGAAACVVGPLTFEVAVTDNFVAGFREEGIALDATPSSSSGPWVTDASVTGNVVTGTGRNGINLRGVLNGSVTGNTVTACGNSSDAETADGINSQTQADATYNKNIVVAGNTVSACEGGIGMDDTIGYSITGNTVTGATSVWSIHTGASSQQTTGAAACGHGAITGNTVRETTGGWPAIAIATGAGHVVTDNLIDANAITDGRGIRVSTGVDRTYIDGNTIERIPDSTLAVVVQATSGISKGRNLIYTSGGVATIDPGAVSASPTFTGTTTFTGPRIDGPVTLTDAATVTVDASTGYLFRVALGGDRSLAVPTNGVDGQRINIEALASSAQRVLTLNASYLLTTGITTPITIPSGKRLFLGLGYVSGVGWFVLAAAVQS